MNNFSEFATGGVWLNGYKEHIATHLSIDELFIDRGYVNSTLVDDVLARGGEVDAKPWKVQNANKELFSKAEFKLNLRDNIITCHAGEVEHFEPGQAVIALSLKHSK